MEIAQTADHALRILLTLGSDGPQSVAELSTRLSLARTVTRRLVVTLQVRSFVRVDGGRVSLGPALLAIAANAMPAIYREAQPILDALSRDFGETVVLSVLDGDDALVVATGRTDANPLRVEYPLGFRHSAAVSAAGRSVLLGADQGRAAAIIDAAGSETIEKYRREQAAGYSASRDELRWGAHGVGIHLRIAGRDASLSVVAPAQRGDDLTVHLDALRAAATRLSAL